MCRREGRPNFRCRGNWRSSVPSSRSSWASVSRASWATHIMVPLSTTTPHPKRTSPSSPKDSCSSTLADSISTAPPTSPAPCRSARSPGKCSATTRSYSGAGFALPPPSSPKAPAAPNSTRWPAKPCGNMASTTCTAQVTESGNSCRSTRPSTCTSSACSGGPPRCCLA